MAESLRQENQSSENNSQNSARGLYSQPYDHFPMAALKLKEEADARAAEKRKEASRQVTHDKNEDEMGYLIPQNTISGNKDTLSGNEPEQDIKRRDRQDQQEFGYMDMSGANNLKIKPKNRISGSNEAQSGYEADQDVKIRHHYDQNESGYIDMSGTKNSTTKPETNRENSTKLNNEEIQALEYILCQNKIVGDRDISGRHSYNVTIVETESSRRNKLDTNENIYSLILDENDATIYLEWNEGSRRPVLTLPINKIRR